MMAPTNTPLGSALFIVLLVVALGWFAWLMYRRIAVIAAGQPQNRFDHIGRRIGAFFTQGIAQTKIRDRRFWSAGYMHTFIFWGFLVVSINTIQMIGQGFNPNFVLPGFHTGQTLGQIYLWLKDIFEVLVLLSVIYALIQRLIIRPKRLTLSASANLILIMIAILMVTDLLMTGLTVTFEADADRTVVGVAFARIFRNTSPEFAVKFFHLNWWLHLLTLLSFFPFLPLSKHFHIITSLPAVFFKRLDSGYVRFLDVENSERFGASRIEHLGWKDLLDVFTCTECGRCQTVCPAFESGKPLSPKEFNIALRHHLIKYTTDIIKDKRQKSQSPRAEKLVGDTIGEETLWACTTCRACEEVCPLSIEFIDRIVEMRRHLVLEESRFPEAAELAFRNLESYGNPWGASDREKWTEGLAIPRAEEKADFEYLFWVGCAGAFDEHAQKTSRAMIKLLNVARVNYAILGNAETCTGDAARRLGNEYLFQTLANQNIETFHNLGVQKIITQCAHCYNTLKNEYPQLGGKFEVISHIEMIANLLAEGRLKINQPLKGKLTYHDACYLGRHNGIYGAPRQIIAALQADFQEATRHGSNALCCGAGGGRMWLEEAPAQRVNTLRAKELTTLNPDIIATACPFCTTMLYDGLKEQNSRVKCLDLAVLVASQLTE